MAFGRKKSLADRARGQAGDVLDAARPRVESALESAKDFVNDTALPALADARDKAAPVIADARDKATPVLLDARDKTADVLGDARDKARDTAAPVVAGARSKAAPVVAAGAAVAGERAAATRELAGARIAKLKGEEPPKSGRLKKFVVLAALAGAVAVVARKLQAGGSSSDNWQSSYTPSPAPMANAPTPAVPETTPGPDGDAHDVAGSGPGEAIADAAETPHPVSTPDEPAEVVDLQPPSDDKS